MVSARSAGLKRAIGALAVATCLQACDDESAPASEGSSGSASVSTAGQPASGGSTPAGGSTSAAGGSTSTAGAAVNHAGRAGASAAGSNSGTLSERYPGDVNIATDPSVLFHDDFEAGWGKWTSPTADTAHLKLEQDAATARAGERYLRSTVTRQQLDAEQYISSSTRTNFDRRVDEIYWRFYARFPEVAPNPHHWVRMAAGDADYSSSGLANTVPAGDDGFWFDFDANDDDKFLFYAYWYRMRSGRCNDGSATPGCAGDQGTTYYYGNVFQPPGQVAYPRDAWFCVEIHAKANAVGSADGELSFWIDDVLVGDYGPGRPTGTWLRAQFHSGGCEFSACTSPAPFTGFDFRSSAEVGFKSIFLDAYYERDSSAQKRQLLQDRGLTVSDAQTVLYDDVVVASERVGCAVRLP